MENLQQSLDKLAALKAGGFIGDAEYDARRKLLVDNYVGVPSLGQSNGPMTYGPQHTGLDPTSFPSKSGGKGLNSPNGFGLPQPRMAVYAPPFGYPTGYYAPMPMLPPFSTGAGRGFRQHFPQSSNTTVKVQPLPPGVTRENLMSIFSVFGEVASAVVKRGSPPYGYVNFVTPQAASAALARGEINILGTAAQVSLGKRQKVTAPEAGPSNGIGLFNLPFSTTHDELHCMLTDYEGFQTIKMVQRKDTGQFKGYAFAYFDTVEHATQAKALLAGLTIGDQHVDVKFASQPADSAAISPTTATIHF